MRRGWGKGLRKVLSLNFCPITAANCFWLSCCMRKVLPLISCQKVCNKILKLHAHNAYAALPIDNLLIEFDCNLILCLLWRICVGGWLVGWVEMEAQSTANK